MNQLRQAAQQALDYIMTNVDYKMGHPAACEAVLDLKEALEPYDQQALELCHACGWKTLIPGDGCLNCERPPRREIELTANAILNMMPDSIPAEHDGALFEFARAVIAAYKEKNK